MATQVQIEGAIIQYAFINQINPVSKKYGYSALIPYDPNCPQCQAVINASNSEWQKVAAGSNNPQSLGYTILAANDAKHIHESVMPMLDPTKNYLQIRAGQDGDSTTLIPVYDTEPKLIPNGGIIGNGTIANIKIAAFGYATSGQKGVKYYAQWIQITKLVENMNAQTGPSAANVPGGYVADATVMSTPAAQVPGVAVAQVGANVMPQAGAVAPAAAIPSAMPGTMPQAQYAQPAVGMPAPVAQPVAAPVQYAQPAPVSMPAPAPQQAPVQYAQPVEQVSVQQYAAPAVQQVAPVQQQYAAPAAPVQQQYAPAAAPAPTAAIAPVASMPAPQPMPQYAAPVGMPVAPGMPQ